MLTREGLHLPFWTLITRNLRPAWPRERKHARCAWSVLAPRDARRMAAAQLSITVPGFSDVTGHTEYIIKSSVGDQQFTVQHRFSNFVELHDALASKIAKLPATFPVAKNMFNGEAVKRERVEKLQEYLRNVVRLSGEKPPIALLKFLKIDASVFAPPSERSERGIATGDGPYPSSSEPLQRFQPFSGVNAAFVPERPEDVNEALREGLKAGDDALCKELIESKADPLYRDRQGARDPRAHTSSAPMPPSLLSDGAHAPRAGNTPLHMACLFNRTDVAKLLLMAGADMTAKNAAGELPERMASVSLKMKFTHFKRTGTI